MVRSMDASVSVEISPEVMAKDADQRFRIRHRNTDMRFQPSRTQQGRIDLLRQIARADDDDALGLRSTVQ